MGREKCCNQFCLSRMNMTEATDIIELLVRIKVLLKERKKQYMHQKILHTCWTGNITIKATTNIYERLDWENFRSRTFVEKHL